MSNPYFSFKKFTIYQHHATMHVTTDSCMLGAYASVDSPKQILDIGSGTGLLAIMAAQRFPEASIHAVEIDRDAVKQANGNIGQCPWKDRLFLHHVKIQDYANNNTRKFDLILCNPPYYENQFKSNKKEINLARHESGLRLTELPPLVKELISDQGHFYIILPAASFIRLKRDFEIPGIFLFDQLSICTGRDKPPYRIIGGFSKQKKDYSENQLILHDDAGNYTSEFKLLLREFYLAF